MKIELKYWIPAIYFVAFEFVFWKYTFYLQPLSIIMIPLAIFFFKQFVKYMVISIKKK